MVKSIKKTVFGGGQVKTLMRVYVYIYFLSYACVYYCFWSFFVICVFMLCVAI